MNDVLIGWDKREAEVYDLCAFSIERRASVPVRVAPIQIEPLRQAGLYTRPTEVRDGRLWDVISEAPMSTEFAITRFMVPHIATSDWAVFCDCDFLWRADIKELFDLADDRYALMCVQHDHRPPEGEKMDGQLQLRYARKNWSSMMLWNLRHPANKRLTVEMINSLPGRDLHRFCWLEDHEIGAVPTTWNWLEGHSDPSMLPNVIHYTRGGPWFADYQDVQYADLWLNELADMKRAQAAE